MYQSIEMFENLQQIDSEQMESQRLTSLQEDFPANLIAWLAGGLHRMMSGTYGVSVKDCFAKLAPNGEFLKMCQGYSQAKLDGSLEEFSGTWPRSGMMRNGLLMRLPMLGRRKDGNGYSSWPTPTAECGDHPGRHKYKQGQQLHLTGAVWPKNWPTPKTPTGGGQVQRNTAGGGIRKLEDAISADVGYNTGQLNADWVELLQGIPVGWTDVDCDEPEPWPGWPAGRGAQQYPYEPPRVIVGQKNRSRRLKCCGNMVVPRQVFPVFAAIMEIEARREATK